MTLDWQSIFYYLLAGAGLLFWPIYQLISRRWTFRAKRLLVVFLVTAIVLAGYASLLWGPWRARESFAPLFCMPIVNIVSLVISTALCFANPARPLPRILRWIVMAVFALLLI